MSLTALEAEEAATNETAVECAALLEQGAALLGRLDAALYANAGRLPAESGVGGHVRHCLDFCNSLLAGLARGRVDYDRRERDLRVERDPVFAAVRLRLAADELRALAPEDDDANLLVKREGADPRDESAWLRSTVGRELQFLASHTIHHYALAALLLRLRGFEPGAEFGVAPSTLRHWRETEAAA